jgi:hypothetical protein
VTESVLQDRVARAVVREVLEELLPRMLAGALEQQLGPPAGGEAPAVVAEPLVRVPAPPVAAVYRPPTWPAARDGAPREATNAGEAPRTVRGRVAVEQVRITTDPELQAFARRLLQVFENPRDRQAFVSGQLRFALLRPAGAAEGGAAVRIERGAVTEKVVDEAAAAGSRLVLAPGAVLTPMARDRARKLGVEIEKERRC